MNILIVDDSPHIRTQLNVLLGSGGYKDLFFAETARESFEHLGIYGANKGKTEIDLVLMDILMPEMDGIEACKIIKNHEHLRDVYVVMVTGEGSPKSLKNAFEAGAVDYVTKPLTKVELLARVGSVLRLKKETDNRKAREKALINSEARYRAIVEDQTELVCRFWPDGSLSFVNQACCRFLKKSAEELQGRKFIEFIYEPDLDKLEEHMESLTMHNPVGEVEHRIVAPSGEIRWLQWTSRVVMDKEGKFVELQSVGRDITDRIKAEEERLVREKLQATLEIAGAVCHEFNQPMQAISGCADLVLCKLSREDSLYEKIIMIGEQIDRMKRLTRKLMGITRYETMEYVAGEKIVDIEKSSAFVGDGDKIPECGDEL